MVGQQVLALLILVRFQVPEPRILILFERSWFTTYLTKEWCVTLLILACPEFDLVMVLGSIPGLSRTLIVRGT